MIMDCRILCLCLACWDGVVFGLPPSPGEHASVGHGLCTGIHFILVDGMTLVRRLFTLFSGIGCGS